MVAAPLAAALTLLGGAVAFAAQSVIVYPYGAIVSPTQVYMVAQITCSPGTVFTGPTVVVTQPQSAELTNQPPTTSGTGTAGTVVCDSQPHYYPIVVTATLGTFAPGLAQADISYRTRTCSPSSPGPPKCVTSAAATEEMITLYQVPSPGQG